MRNLAQKLFEKSVPQKFISAAHSFYVIRLIEGSLVNNQSGTAEA